MIPICSLSSPMVKIDVTEVKEFFIFLNSKQKTFCDYTRHQIYAY